MHAVRLRLIATAADNSVMRRPGGEACIWLYSLLILTRYETHDPPW
jgi:hypothetical protein